MKLADCELIDLPTITDDRGKLTVIEGDDQLPFEIRRVYYLYDVPDGVTRGAHAHKELRQLLIAMSGGLDVVLDDGTDQRRVRLDRPECGLLIGSMIWRTLENFSDGTVCCVLASASHRESDYVRDYEKFIAMVGAN